MFLGPDTSTQIRHRSLLHLTHSAVFGDCPREAPQLHPQPWTLLPATAPQPLALQCRKLGQLLEYPLVFHASLIWGVMMPGSQVWVPSTCIIYSSSCKLPPKITRTTQKDPCLSLQGFHGTQGSPSTNTAQACSAYLLSPTWGLSLQVKKLIRSHSESQAEPNPETIQVDNWITASLNRCRMVLWRSGLMGPSLWVQRSHSISLLIEL